MKLEVRLSDHLFVNLHLLRELQYVRYLDLHNTIKNRLIGVLRLETIPFGLVAVREDDTVKVKHRILTWGRNLLFLSCSEDRVKELNLILENLNKLHNAAVTYVESTVEIENSWVILRVLVKL